MNNVLLNTVIPHYHTVSRIQQETGAKIFLVGGALRDFVLKRKTRDFDFIVFEKPEDVSRRFADATGGTLVVLDESERIYRVVFEGYEYDFSLPKGPDLFSDAEKRDFTINTLMADISRLDSPLLDFCGALDDLSNRVIRAPSETTFAEDPLRLLRAFRFYSELFLLNFRIDDETIRKISLEKPRIETVSRERIRDEFVKLFCAKASYDSIKLMDSIGLLTIIVPVVETMRGITQNQYHTEDVWGHSLLTLKYIESILEELPIFMNSHPRVMKRYFEKKYAGGWTTSSLLKFVALFHDLGKPKTRYVREGGDSTFYGHENHGAILFENVARDMLVGKRGVRFGSMLIKNHMRLLSLATSDTLTTRALARLIRDVGEHIPSLLLLGIADTHAGHADKRRIDSSFKLASDIYSFYQDVIGDKLKMRPLLSGTEIMEATNIGEGALVGRLKSDLLDAQISGEIKTKEEAKCFIKKTIKTM